MRRVEIEVYRTLLGLYPADFRNAYGAEMLRLFRDRCRHEGCASQPWRVARLWAETGLDLLLTLPGEHAEALRRRYESPLVPMLMVGSASVAATLSHWVLLTHVRVSVWRPAYPASGDLSTTYFWGVAGAFVGLVGGVALATANWRRLRK